MQTETILIVEDDSDLRAYVSDILTGLRYRVVAAPNAEAALEILKDGKTKVDLLLTDVIMPGMNGRELAAEALNFKPDLQVIYMTGYSRNAVVHQGRWTKASICCRSQSHKENLRPAFVSRWTERAKEVVVRLHELKQRHPDRPSVLPPRRMETPANGENSVKNLTWCIFYNYGHYEHRPVRNPEDKILPTRAGYTKSR